MVWDLSRFSPHKQATSRTMSQEKINSEHSNARRLGLGAISTKYAGRAQREYPHALWCASLRSRAGHLTCFQNLLPSFPIAIESTSPRPHHPPLFSLSAPYTQHARQPMEDSKKGEGGESESPPLQIDPKWCVRWPTLLASLTAEPT